jgi:formamidopyrimidine-DNA glycosylase
MPELPEVETVRRTLEPVLAGQVLLAVKRGPARLRFPVEEQALQRLCGQRLLRVERRGKALVFVFCDAVLLFHLGMSGRLWLRPPGSPLPPHTHGVFAFERWQLLFVDPRRFGFFQVLEPSEVASHFLLGKLGPEPFAVRQVTAALAQRSSSCRRVRDVLLDQRVVAGVGNIYACEALFAAKIHPGRPLARIGRRKLQELAEALARVMTSALAAGGTTLRDGSFRDALGEPGFFALELAVYGREGEPCRRCSTPIARLRLGGRSAYFCPRCQR